MSQHLENVLKRSLRKLQYTKLWWQLHLHLRRSTWSFMSLYKCIGLPELIFMCPSETNFSRNLISSWDNLNVSQPVLRSKNPDELTSSTSEIENLHHVTNEIQMKIRGNSFRALNRCRKTMGGCIFSWEFQFLLIRVCSYPQDSLSCVRTRLQINAVHWFPFATLLSKCCQAICRLLQDADLYVLITFSSQLWWSPSQSSNKIKPPQCNFTGRHLEVVKSLCVGRAGILFIDLLCEWSNCPHDFSTSWNKVFSLFLNLSNGFTNSLAWPWLQQVAPHLQFYQCYSFMVMLIHI